MSDDRDRSCAVVDIIAKIHLAEVDRKIPIFGSCGVSWARWSRNASAAPSRNVGSSMRCRR